MPVTYSNIASLGDSKVAEKFKRIYLKAVSALPDSNPLTAQLKKTSKFKVGPDGMYFNVKLAAGGKVANVPDAKLLPSPASPHSKTGKTQIVHTYTTIAIGGQSIHMTKSGDQAFTPNLQDQLDDAIYRVANDVERQYNGDGRGILCLLETVSSAPTYDVYRPYGKVGAGPGTMLLVEGMEIAIINPSNGAERGRTTIASIDETNEQMTLESAVSGAAIGDYVVLCNDTSATGSDQANNYGNEAAGILAVCGTDTFENIDPSQAGNRRWKAVVMSSSGAISRIKLAKLEATIRTKSGRKPTLHYTTPGLVIALQSAEMENQRYMGETVTLQAEYPAVKVGNRVVLEGDYCPKGHWFALNLEAECAGWADLAGAGWVDEDGAKLHRVEGRHAYRADYWLPHQAIWYIRNAHGVITGLDDDVTIVR